MFLKYNTFITGRYTFGIYGKSSDTQKKRTLLEGTNKKGKKEKPFVAFNSNRHRCRQNISSLSLK